MLPYLHSGAWLALLALRLPEDVRIKSLLRLPGGVLPHLVSPLLLADALTAALDGGGLAGMLALNAIFLLVTQVCPQGAPYMSGVPIKNACISYCLQHA